MYSERNEEEEEDEDTKRRKAERGKRRFEEGFDHINEDFYQSWQARTKKG